MSARETTLYAAIGFGVWLSGAVLFRFSGALLFENGPIVLAAAALGIAASVCFLLKATMDWRKASAKDAVTIAVIMALPGLLGDVAYILAFHQITGLAPATAGPYSALIIFGNAALLAYALWKARPQNLPAP
jgi:hypothetical protein